MVTGGTVGTFSATAGAGFDQTRTALRENKVFIYMPTLLKKGEVSEVNDCANPNADGVYLEGHLGLYEWLLPSVQTEQFTQKLAPLPKKMSSNDRPSAVLAYERTPLNPMVEPFFQMLLNAAQNGAATGSAQAPIISATFTFTIKATGGLGPSFTLARVSSQANANVFSVTRIDNNYVNIVLTPSTYCPDGFSKERIEPPPTKPSDPKYAWVCKTTGGINLSGTKSDHQPNVTDVQNAISRIDTALFNLNLQRALPP